MLPRTLARAAVDNYVLSSTVQDIQEVNRVMFSDNLAFVPDDEVHLFESKVKALVDLLHQAQGERGKKLGPSFAHQAAREALRLQERVYRLMPAVGVIPNELVLPVGVLPDAVTPVDRPSAGQMGAVTSHLPALLVPQQGHLPEQVTTERRQISDELTPILAAAYALFNAVLRETGLGEAMRTASLIRWTETFGP